MGRGLCLGGSLCLSCGSCFLGGSLGGCLLCCCLCGGCLGCGLGLSFLGGYLLSNCLVNLLLCFQFSLVQLTLGLLILNGDSLECALFSLLPSIELSLSCCLIKSAFLKPFCCFRVA